MAKGLQNVKILMNLEPFMKQFFEKKSHRAEKNLKGAVWSRPVLYVTRESFLVQFLGVRGTIWRLLKIL